MSLPAVVSLPGPKFLAKEVESLMRGAYLGPKYVASYVRESLRELCYSEAALFAPFYSMAVVEAEVRIMTDKIYCDLLHKGARSRSQRSFDQWDVACEDRFRVILASVLREWGELEYAEMVASSPEMAKRFYEQGKAEGGWS